MTAAATTVVQLRSSKGQAVQRKLEELPDDEFHKLVDQELRRTHSNTPEHEQRYLNTIADKLRHPAVIDRWIMELSIMKASAETQLGARRADLKKIHGTVPEGDYQSRKRAFDSWRAGNMRFLHSVQQRLLEARYERAKMHSQTTATQESLDMFRRAIENHRAQVLSEDYEPTDADTSLWSVVPEEE